jgi:two-component system chemotaxis sensor kinase CheA
MDRNNFDPNMINLFKQEALKHILTVNNLLLSIEKEGVKKGTFINMKREVHTLKGDSRMLGINKISDASHKLEDLFELLGKNEKTIDKNLIEKIFKSLDAIQNAVDRLPDEEIDIDIQAIISQDHKIDEKKDDGKIEIFEPISQKTENNAEKKDESRQDKQPESKSIDYINLRLKKIDDLINLFSVFPRYSNRFNFILNQLRSVRDSIDMKYHDDEITKNLDAFINDFSHEITFYDLIAKQFQNEITKIKLVPLATIFDLFPRLVRDIAQQTNKKINFVIKGKEVELDKGVVDKLKEILIHILNNSVDHGCEEPEVREKLGKPKEGNIILSAYNKGDNVVIEITDDGNGIDVDRVRQKAIERGLISKEKANVTSDEDMIPFIFEAGFSTKQVSKFSGRGVGMDVVAKIVKDLNGEIKVNTWKGKGTTFIINLPLISFYIPVTIIQLGERIIGIPSSYIMQALRVKDSDIKKIGKNQELISIHDMEISLIDIQYLFDGINVKTDSYKNIIIVKYLDEIAGLIVTDVVLEKKMIIKKVSGLTDRFKLIIGAVLLGNERAIPVLNIFELFKLLKEGSVNITKVKSADETKKIWAKNILLVEDSPITREHEKKILINQNLNVFEANNGKEAIKYLENQKFDLIITDIEMPVMDGTELIKFIKNDDRFNMIPIIVVSSYKDYEDKLQEMGVRHFINKNDFNAQIFLNILKEESII